MTASQTRELNINNVDDHPILPIFVTETSGTPEEAELLTVGSRYPARRRQPVVRFLAVMITIMLQLTAAEVPLTEIIRRAAHSTSPYYLIYEGAGIKIPCRGVAIRNFIANALAENKRLLANSRAEF